VISVDLVSARAFFLLLHAKLRVHRASGIPCALVLLKAREIPANLGRVASRDGGVLPRHCERKRSNPESLRRRDSGLLRRKRFSQ
jgi:hypothetical protein